MTVRNSFPSFQNKDIFHVIFDNTYQFVGLLDARGTALEVNQTALAFAGVTREQVVGKPIWDTPWFARELRPQLEEVVARAVRGEFVCCELEILQG